MGSQMFKQQRSGSDEESWRMNKSFKVNASSEAGSLFLGSGSAMVSGDDGQTMLCFSSNNNSKAQEPPFLGRLGGGTSSRNQEMIPLFQAQQPPLYARGNVLTSPSFSRFKGPFTPSQWMELEHQALVYKHFVNNVPVPQNLLFSVLKTLPPYAYSNFSSGSSLSNQIGWGTLSLGYNRNTDPEPGRCRRTDGKKWRCSRDSVPDQKYCERHINRGRHRSRKPVEGPPGQAGSGPTPPPKVPSESMIVPGFENLNQLNEAAFGVVSSDSLLNPSQKGPIPYMGSGSGQETHDWTKLSMSIPTQQKKLSLAPLRFDPIQIGLSVEAIPKQNDNWAPLAWENSMGGPLGEIVAEGWVNNNNPQMRASPTRVLHNSTFISLSNSSSGSGSSSRGENNEAPEAPNFCDNFLGSSGFPLI